MSIDELRQPWSPPLWVLYIDIGQGLFWRWVRLGFSKFPAKVNRILDLFGDRIQFRFLSNPTINDGAAQGRNWIAGMIGLFLLFGPMRDGIALELPVVAIGLALDQTRAFTPPRACDGLASRLVDREDIQPIDGHAWHPVAGGAVGNIATAHVIGHRCRFGIAIVLGHENHRQFPDTRKIESFMEGALIGRAIPKETDGHLASAIVLRGEPCSRRQGEAATHNAIGPEHPLVDVCDMH